MGFKLFVALQLEVAHHFIERFAFRSTGGFEPPSTFGATKTLKTLQLNPYQLPAHRCLCRANEYQRAVIAIKDRSLHTPILMGLSGILHTQILFRRPVFPLEVRSNRVSCVNVRYCSDSAFKSEVTS
jgi:hypothetical protein